MTTHVTDIDLDNPQVVELIEGDEHLRTLPLDSDDLKAAVSERLAKKDENSASADTENEEAEASDDDDEEDDDEADTQERKPKRGVVRRIQKLVSEKRDMERRIQLLEQTLQQSMQQTVEQTVGGFKFDEPEPSVDDFTNIVEFNKAVARWEFRRLKAEDEYNQQLEQVQREVKEVAQRWEKLEKEVKKRTPDYSEVVTADAVMQLSQAARDFLAESEYGPDVLYTLLSEEDIDDFNRASNARQVKLLTKLEERLEGSRQTKQDTPTTKSKLKTPEELPRGKSTAMKLDLIQDADKMSDEEWSRAYDAQRRKR